VYASHPISTRCAPSDVPSNLVRPVEVTGCAAMVSLAMATARATRTQNRATGWVQSVRCVLTSFLGMTVEVCALEWQLGSYALLTASVTTASVVMGSVPVI